MPKIIPIRDLKNTSQISQMCHESDEPIFVTKKRHGNYEHENLRGNNVYV